MAIRSALAAGLRLTPRDNEALPDRAQLFAELLVERRSLLRLGAVLLIAFAPFDFFWAGQAWLSVVVARLVCAIAVVSLTLPVRRVQLLPFWFVGVGILASLSFGLAAHATGGADSPYVPVLYVLPLAYTLLAPMEPRAPAVIGLVNGLVGAWAIFPGSSLAGCLMWVALSGSLWIFAVGVSMHDLASRFREQRLMREQRRLEARLSGTQKLDAIGRLAGGVAHDFNNLLSVIISYSDLLLHTTPSTDPRHSDVTEIRNAGRRAAELTHQLLAFSRKQMLAPTLVDLNALVHDMGRMMRRLIGEDIELRCLLDATIGRVKADPSQLEQVIMNLVVNARDAMPRGGRLTLETVDAELSERFARRHPGAAAGPHVLLSVSDTGHGMDERTLAGLFEPFFTTKERGKGTGLGLSTVYGIVKQSGGSIFVESEVGVGTRFLVYLPRFASAEKADAVANDAPQGAGAKRPGPGGETVLLVEDDHNVRALVSRVLEEQGYRVLDAADPRDALGLVKKHLGQIDLLLSDVVMPGMNGPELAKQILALRPSIRVILMSGYTDNAIVTGAIEHQGVAFLHKPVTPESVTRTVRDVLDAPVKNATPARPAESA